MGVVLPQLAAASEDRTSGALVIDGGLRFDSSKSHYLSRTPGSAGNRRTWTWSGWVKRNDTSSQQTLFSAGNSGTNRSSMLFDSSVNGALRYFNYASSVNVNLISSQVFRDAAGWYHIVVAFDSTQATEANRLKFYVNGVQVTNFSTATYPSQNLDVVINNNLAHSVGRAEQASPAEHLSGQISNAYFIDSQALDPSYFGYTDPLTNTWRPKKYKTSIDTYVNNGTVWSNSWGATGSTGNVDNGANAFDGSLSTYASNQNSNTTVIWQPSSPIPVRRTLRVYAAAISSGAGQVAVNGTSLGTIPGSTPQWFIIQGATQLTSISLTDTGSTHGRLYAVEVDGVILVNSSTSNSLVDNYFFGTNGFYLPFDGNSPIGQDQSGRGNNWTPVNFGGSNTLEKATGALPILNTDGGGKVARVGVRTDSNASSLVLALPLVGIKSDFSNAINSGTTEKVVTNSGVTFASPGVDTFYGTYGYFVQSQSDYLEAASTTDFAFGTGDFTLEARIYAVSLPGTNNRIITSGTGSAGDRSNFQLMVGSAGYLEFDNTSTYQSATGLITTGRWYHVAATKSSGTLRLFIDGVIVKEQSDSYNVTENGGVTVGREATQSSYWNGYISDVRVYKGVAKYTQNFIPASTDPDILPDTPSGVAYSSNVVNIVDGAVAFDGSGDYLSLASNTDFAFGTGDFTVEAFVYKDANDADAAIFDLGSTNTSGSFAIFWNSTSLIVRIDGTGNDLSITKEEAPSNKWIHIAVARSGSTLRLFVDGALKASGTRSNNITQSTPYIGDLNLFDYDFTGFISNLHIIKGTALYTSNFTPPTGPISSVANTKLLCCKSNSSATVSDTEPSLASQLNAPLSSTPFTDSSTNAKTITNPDSITTTSAGTNSFNLTTVANFNGSQRLTTTQTGMPLTGAWTIDTYIKIDSSASGYNAIINTGYASGADKYVYIGIDDSDKPYIEDVGTTGTKTTASSTISKNTWYHIRVTQGDGSMKFYVNGTLYVSHPTNTFNMVTGGTFTIGSLLSGSNNANNFHGLMGPVRYVNGNLGAPAAGGEATSSGTLSNTPTGQALALFGNTAATNFNPFTVNINTQRGQESGYATLNPLQYGGTVNAPTNGNLNITSASSGYGGILGTIGMSAGKWYFEFVPSTTNSALGIAKPDTPVSSYLGQYSGAYIYLSNGNKANNNSYVSYANTFTSGDTIGVSFDADNGILTFYKNGISQGTAYTGLTSGPYLPAFSDDFGSAACDGSFNFGQKPFKFPPPAGFQPLALANTPRPTIVRPDQYVGIVTYTGTNAARSLTTGFKPDFVWIKVRGATGGPVIVDSVRGSSATLQTHATTEEQIDGDAVTGFNSYGFSLGSGFTVVNVNNSSPNYYVAWAWKAGGNSNTFNINDIGYSTASAAGLTAGTITPTGASVNTKSGFSIIKYTGTGANATISHGIGKAPAFMIVKNRDLTDVWMVYHSSLGATKYIILNRTDPAGTVSTAWNNTAPTSSVFSVGSLEDTNRISNKFIAYLWAEIPGFSKFGSYTGTSGQNFVELGFKPAWVMIKNSSSSSYPTYTGWTIFDGGRTPYNVVSNALFANKNQAENLRGNGGSVTVADFSLDLLSNGFCLRDNGASEINLSGNSYIYAAFAETPSFNLYGGQSNAR